MRTTRTLNGVGKNRASVAPLAVGGTLGALLAAAAGALLVRLATAHRRPRPVAQELLHAGQERVQLPSEGAGTLFHRSYSVVIDRPRLKGRRLMDTVKANLRDFSPRLLADFHKTKGHPRTMRVGDEYQITILGPWNGGVRVSEVTPTSFTFVTLEGHPEAGQITFAVTNPVTRPGAIGFEINSWARSRDMLVGLSYDQGQIGRKVQENAWVTFCQRVAAASGGVAHGDVEVVTERHSPDGEVIPVV